MILEGGFEVEALPFIAPLEFEQVATCRSHDKIRVLSRVFNVDLPPTPLANPLHIHMLPLCPVTGVTSGGGRVAMFFV